MTIAQLNAADRATFVSAIGFVFEHSPWIAEGAWKRRPFADVDGLYLGMLAALDEAPPERRITLINAHPDLAARVVHDGRLTPTSRDEQASAGLDHLAPQQIARLDSQSAAYRAHFGFPFVICVRENTTESLLAALASRLKNDRATEIEAALAEIKKIARLRLLDAVTG